MSSTEFGHSPDESLRFERFKRASGSGRGKPNRQLAKLPPKTTTTTTSTTTSTTTTSEPATTILNTGNEYSADSPALSEDDEYEEAGENDLVGLKKPGEGKSSMVKGVDTKKPEKTSVTTIDPNCETSTTKSAKSSKGRGKGKQQGTTSTTTEQVIEYEEEEEEEVTTTAAPVGSKKKPSKSTKKPVINKDAGLV